MRKRDRLVHTSRLVVRTARIGILLLLLALMAGLLFSWIFRTQFAEWVLPAISAQELGAAMPGVRWLIVIGIAGSAAAERIFAALTRIIGTVSAGDPFVIENARRLQSMGWALFALELLDIPAGLLGRFYPGMGPAAPTGTISFVGLISVLMVFVLSRVFAAGSAMRDELEGTV